MAFVIARINFQLDKLRAAGFLAASLEMEESVDDKLVEFHTIRVRRDERAAGRQSVDGV